MYFGSFKLSHFQIKSLFDHFASDVDKSQLDYYKFVKEICGPVSGDRIKVIDETMAKLTKFDRENSEKVESDVDKRTLDLSNFMNMLNDINNPYRNVMKRKKSTRKFTKFYKKF